MNKLELLLKENWDLLQELFELPKDINTKHRGDDFFKNGQYGDNFWFTYNLVGKSGKNYTMIFNFSLRALKRPEGSVRSFNQNTKKGQQEVQLEETNIPVYEITFYPENKEGTKQQWELLNDINPSRVVVVAGYLAFFHASTLLKDMVPSPFVDYMFRPFKEQSEKELSAKDSKRGSFYNRAIPKVFEELSHHFKDIEVYGVDTHPEYTLAKIKRA